MNEYIAIFLVGVVILATLVLVAIAVMVFYSAMVLAGTLADELSYEVRRWFAKRRSE